MHDQLVALNGKIYIRSGDRDDNVTVLEYTPGSDQWAELPPPPVRKFTVATLRGQLLVVGGRDKSTHTKYKVRSLYSMNTLDNGSRLILPCQQH